jgi:hypothetical protein
MLFLSAVLTVGEIGAQENKQEEPKEDSKAPAKTPSDSVKGDGMKCCEDMKKTSEKKSNVGMKAKMEKMKEKKEKTAEKTKGKESMKMKEMKDDAKTSEANQDKQHH